jgi:hypothetical protein
MKDNSATQALKQFLTKLPPTTSVCTFMKTRNLGIATLIVATCAVAGSSFAQDAETMDMTRGRHPRVRQVNRRFERQQDRIAAGVNSGQLTAAETARLEQRERHLKQQEIADRQANGGHLTKQEAAQLNTKENRLNRAIFAQKHDAQTATTVPKSQVGARVENQQDRIASGIKSGNLTAGEASRIEAREAELRHQILTDRNANGGKLTPAERQQINGELDQLSTRIEKQKHDEQTQGQH